ncbi:hypothetical protein CEXT_324831 [Caerostris extrusa]|uniref:Uncharacterized protein n=1 Tax=Caerostris extrusa TaxID=172846 RepID=A0AAV4W577_CAEEX|nr:hypothetical protein CEXT_324831 [Caerostris extrusa]
MTDEEEWLSEDDGSGSSEDDLSLSFDENEVEESIEEFRSTSLSSSSISVDQLLVAPSMNMDTEELDEFCFNNNPVAASTPAEDFTDTTKFNYTGNFNGDDHFVPIQETELDLTHGKAIPITSTHNYGDNLHYRIPNINFFQRIPNINFFQRIQTSTSSRGFQTSTSSRGFQTSTSSRGFQTSTSSRGFQTSSGYNNGDNLHHGHNHLRYSTHSGAFQTPTRYNYKGNIRHERGYRMAPVRLLQSSTTRCNYEDNFHHVQSIVHNSTPVGTFQTRRRYNYQDNLHDEHEHLSNATPARPLKNIKKNPVTLNTLVEEFRNTLRYNPEDNLSYNEDHVPNSTPDRDKTLKSISSYLEFEIPDTLKEPYIEANSEIYDYNNPESNFLKETNGKGANSIPDSTFDDSQSLNSCSTSSTTDSEQTMNKEQKSSLDVDNNNDDKNLQEIKKDGGAIRHNSFFKSSRFASEKHKKIAKYLERLKNAPICPLSNPGHSSEDERIMIPVKLNGVPEGKTY